MQKVPSRDRAIPVPLISRYFQVASKARGVPLKCSSGTVAIVSASVVTQSNPRWRAWWAALSRPSDASSDATNTRLWRSERILR